MVAGKLPGIFRARENPAVSLKRRGFVCALDWNRTNDLLLRRQTLYPLSYEGSQGSCRYRRDVLELSRKVGSKGKSTLPAPQYPEKESTRTRRAPAWRAAVRRERTLAGEPDT